MAYFREMPSRSLMSPGPISLRSRKNATSLPWIESSACAWKKSESLTRTSLPDWTRTWKSSCSSSPATPARPNASYALGGVYARRNVQGLRPMIPAFFQVTFALVMTAIPALLLERPWEGGDRAHERTPFRGVAWFQL